MRTFPILLILCLAWLSGAAPVWAKAVEAITSQAGVAATDKEVKKSLGGGAWQNCQVGDILHAGDKIKTGEESTAWLLLADRSVMRLAPNTKLTILDLVEQENGCWVRRFQLSLGRVFADVTPAPNGSQSVYEIKGPTAVAAVHGKAFEMDLTGKKGATDMKVWDGTVGSRKAKTGDYEVPVGVNSQLRVHQDGTPQRLTLTRQQADVWQEESLKTRDKWRSQKWSGGRLSFEPSTFESFQQAHFRMTPEEGQAHERKRQDFLRTHPQRPPGQPEGKQLPQLPPGALHPDKTPGLNLADIILCLIGSFILWAILGQALARLCFVGKPARDSFFSSTHPSVIGVLCLYPGVFVGLLLLQAANKGATWEHIQPQTSVVGISFGLYMLCQALLARRVSLDATDYLLESPLFGVVEKVGRASIAYTETYRSHKYTNVKLMLKDGKTIFTPISCIYRANVEDWLEQWKERTIHLRQSSVDPEVRMLEDFLHLPGDGNAS